MRGDIEELRNRGVEEWQFNNSDIAEISQEQQTDKDLFAYSLIYLFALHILTFVTIYKRYVLDILILGIDMV